MGGDMGLSYWFNVIYASPCIIISQDLNNPSRYLIVIARNGYFFLIKLL